jgi:hypothetical protein
VRTVEDAGPYNDVANRACMNGKILISRSVKRRKLCL